MDNTDDLAHQNMVNDIIAQVADQRVGSLVKHFAFQSLMDAKFSDATIDKVIEELDNQHSFYQKRRCGITAELPQNAYAASILQDIESVVTEVDNSNLAKLEEVKTSLAKYLISEDFEKSICVDAN